MSFIAVQWLSLSLSVESILKRAALHGSETLMEILHLIKVLFYEYSMAAFGWGGGGREVSTVDRW